jgi:hypothetical protein
VQCRETFDRKEIQAAQIKDQSTATHQVLHGVASQSLSVKCIDVPAGADDGYERPQPTMG